MTPLVSIGMPLRNEEKYLPAALDSLLAQDFKDFELIISDNASTDRTPDICREYAKKDSRIRYDRNDVNIGMTGNQNRVFELSSGEFFMWAAGHDLWHQSFIRRCLEVMKQDPGIALCHPLICSIGFDGKPLPDPYPCRLDTRGLGSSARANVVVWGLGTGGAIYGFLRSSALRSTRLFRNVICPDNLILFELSLAGSIAHLPEPLFFLRTNADERVHMSKSMDRYRTMFYPECRRHFRLWLTNWRLLYEHLAAVIRAPMKLNRKPVLLALVLFGLLCRRGKHMLHDLVEALGFPRP